VKDSLSKEESQIKEIYSIFGIPDYDKIFKDVIPAIKGLSNMKVVRITADLDGRPRIVNKVCVASEGWHPRPYDQIHREVLREFQENDFSYGIITRISKPVPNVERCSRDHWNYTVRFADGFERIVSKRCLSLPVNMKEKEQILQDLKNVPIQSFDQKLFNTEFRSDLHKLIIKMLTMGRCDRGSFQAWEVFFGLLDRKAMHPELSYCADTYYSLAISAGGQMQVSKPRQSQ
jgi:hypothetical protein